MVKSTTKTTIVSSPFSIEHYNDQHKKLFTEAASLYVLQHKTKVDPTSLMRKAIIRQDLKLIEELYENYGDSINKDKLNLTNIELYRCTLKAWDPKKPYNRNLQEILESYHSLENNEFAVKMANLNWENESPIKQIELWADAFKKFDELRKASNPNVTNLGDNDPSEFFESFEDFNILSDMGGNAFMDNNIE